MEHYIIALGSNLGDSLFIMKKALRCFESSSQGKVLGVSPVFQTAPTGGIADRPFLNAAAIVSSDLAPKDFLSLLLFIEKDLGRTRTKRWENRIIDLDILLWKSKDHSDLSFQSEALLIPHPRLLERDFMLVPASIVVPNWIHPETKKSLIVECSERAYFLATEMASKNWYSVTPSTNDNLTQMSKDGY